MAALSNAMVLRRFRAMVFESSWLIKLSHDRVDGSEIPLPSAYTVQENARGNVSVRGWSPFANSQSQEKRHVQNLNVNLQRRACH
jgi:hypothetical protein